MVDIATGEIKGRHDGLMYYTLGQRQGLGIGGSGNGEPWFVAEKDLSRNILYVVQGDKHHSLYSTSLIASGVNWINGQELGPEPLKCTAKFRYRQPDQGVTLTAREDGTINVDFDVPQKRLRQAKPLSSISVSNVSAAARSNMQKRSFLQRKLK